MCKYELPTSRLSTDKQTDTTEIINYAASRVVKNQSAKRSAHLLAYLISYGQLAHVATLITTATGFLLLLYFVKQ